LSRRILFGKFFFIPIADQDIVFEQQQLLSLLDKLMESLGRL